MSTDLYEELGISSAALPEQIRKAYKKKALQTHPDRLPPGASQSEKAASEERFRKVNNAYEVLIDENKRSGYDTHGVWPPPEEPDFPSSHMPRGGQYRAHSHHRHPSRSQTFPDQNFMHHHAPFTTFHFTDPFTLFESIFEGAPGQHRSSRHHHHSRSADLFTHMHRMQAEIEDFMDDIDRDPFGMGSGMPRFAVPPLSSFQSLGATPHSGNQGRWVSESYMTSTVNGVTQTIHKRIDSDGNEHITRTMPDGREVRTINGVDQNSRGFLPYADPSKSRHQPQAYLPSATSHGLPLANASRVDYGALLPPPYSAPPAGFRDNSHRTTRRRSHDHSEKTTYPSTNNEHLSHDPSRQKKWWQGSL